MLLLLLAAIATAAAYSDPVADCEACLRLSFHAFCFTDNQCYEHGTFQPPSECQASECASGHGLGGVCECSACCGTDNCGAPQCPGPSPSPPPAPPQCSKRIQYPTGHFPTLQAQRPPQQTAVQAAVVAGNVKDAADKSAAAEPWVRTYLETTVRKGITNLWCANASTDELLEILKWEFAHQSILHNGPVDKGDPTQISDDTDLFTTLSNGYLQNVCQRYVLGVEASNNFVGESNIMVEYMNYPPFTNTTKPTLREANDRVVYLASNWRKTNAGNFEYGKATYVINPLYQDKFFIAPGDTGAYAGTWGKPMPIGTLDNWLHLLQPHLSTYNYDLSTLFQRWYAGAPAPDKNLFYFEVEFSGNAWLPECLLYIVPLFSTMWGNAAGRQLQTWARANGRPLVWADGDSSGMLIDPVVNQVAAQVNVTAGMAAAFNAAWEKTPALTNFTELFDASDPALQFFLPSYTKKDVCDNDPAVSSASQVMGTNAAGKCVYWDMEPPQMWECLNDGTCAQGTLAGRGTFFTEDDCLKNCGQSKWSCMQNAIISGCAGEAATNCVPDPQGICGNVTECEQMC